MIEELKDLKNLYESVRNQIDRGKEPVEEMKVLLNFLRAVQTDNKLIHEKMDKDYRRYFYDDFANGFLKKLTRERSRDDNYLDLISHILESFLIISIEELKNKHYNQQFFDSIKLIFDYDSILHNQNYQIPEEQLKAIRSQNQQWRKDLKVGDMVDAIQDQLVRCTGWSQAKIESVTGDTLHLEFIYDTKSTDRYLDRWSVEIAPFESKTKELFDWKAQLKQDQMVDAHDKSCWNKSTILELKEDTSNPSRTVTMAYIGFRIYYEKATKVDEQGRNYDGWSCRFDEWVPLYSPRIMPFYTKTQKGMVEEYDIDEDLDSIFEPEKGFSRVWAVPRVRKCISSAFIHHMNVFGEQGGFNLIENALKQEYSEELTLNFFSTLIEAISKPYLIYHSEFSKQYCPKIVELAKISLRQAPEKQLRDVKRERIEQIIKSIDCLQRRSVAKDDREKETETLKLEICLMCLKSNYLDKRIQGIRELNTIIRNNRMINIKSFTNEQLIEWLKTNDVFSQLFDNKKTHLQIVQRTAEILKLLLYENQLDQELLDQFWALSKTDYKFEIYKIVNQISYYLKQDHIDFIFNCIKQILPEKLGIEEFSCLSELGKYAKDETFKEQISDFFWQIICNADNYKDELVTNCINRFCEMVKYWDMNKKEQFFLSLLKNLEKKQATIPCIRLFRNLIKDQKDRGLYYSNRNYNQQSEIDQPQQEKTLEDTIEELLQKHKLIQIIFDNFEDYYQQILKSDLIKEANNINRKKLFFLNERYSHHIEIDERLQFLKYIASISQYKISKLELQVIYKLLANSVIQSDQEEFLLWCKSSCEQSSLSTVILDLDEVGEFFTEKMKSKELDVENLLVVGFEFLQHYFLSVNEKERNLFKSSKPQKKQESNVSSLIYTQKNKAQSYEEDSGPIFKIIKEPSQLQQLDIVWNMALQCKQQQVVPKAIDFLIKVYSCVDEDLNAKLIQIQDELIDKCMNILKEVKDEFTIKRTLEIIKNIIYEAEKKGTGDVQPHNAVLKGELLDKILIKNRASSNKGNILLQVYSNCTVWELRKEVAQSLDLAPKYLKLELQNNQVIRESENGKTLAQLNIQNKEVMFAYKINIEEEVANAPLIGLDGKLTEKASQIFNEWFDMYSNEKDQMTPETCGLFVRGCTGEIPGPNDERIQKLFKQYDRNNDQIIDREDFMLFYETAAKVKPDTVRENLKAHNIRNDLKKLSEIQEVSQYSFEDMPRYKISKNQQYFDQLMAILDRPDQSAQDSWDLIQMLATNQGIYTRVLELKLEKDEKQQDKIDWDKFFDSQSVYKLLYTLQIIEAVMEEDQGQSQRILVIKDEDEIKNRIIPQAPPLPGAMVQQMQQQQQQQQQEEQKQEVKQEVKSKKNVLEESKDKELKVCWTQMFLQHKGFQYILNVFMQKQIKNEQEQEITFNQVFELKHIAFLLKLLRIFIMGAFSTSQLEANIYETANLIRKSSVQGIEDNQVPQEGSTFRELQKLLEGEMGIEIIESINYQELQNRILRIISEILGKNNLIYEDKLIIENALSLWMGCILHKNNLFDEFYEFKFGDGQITNSNQLILTGLLYCPYDKVREEFKTALISLCKYQIKGKQDPLYYFLKLLSNNFNQIAQYQCKQYFELFCQLIDRYFIQKQISGSIQEDIFDPEALLSTIIDNIKQFNDKQKQLSEDDSDELLDSEEIKARNEENENIFIGLIQLTGKIIDNFEIQFCEKVVQQKDLIDQIFSKFLFSSVFKENQNQEVTIKIKNKQQQRQIAKKNMLGKKSKDQAYKLLNSLIRKSPQLFNNFLKHQMMPLIQLIRRIEGWNYSPPGSSERSQQYVGLRNLGCICYMNSMLQQFFMIPTFRYNLLTVDDQTAEVMTEYKGNMIDDNVLHQLQKLMAHLELSERSDYNPYEFCFAFKDLDGNPTNLGEQKDAQEFLNLSFDRIENLLKNTSRKYLLQSVFGGKICNQMVCQECGKVKNKIEDFYNLSLTVKDIKSMKDSLNKMLEGEVVNDFLCEGCNKKVDISMRTLISSTPNVLIVHLQRIIFNFDTLRNDKINSYFEFPFQLDLKPFSFYEVMRKENRLPKKEGDEQDEQQQEENKDDNKQEETVWPEEEDCFEYKLVGATVHSGTANAGHYWSYINIMRGFQEPNESDPNWDKTEAEPWMEFNDAMVRNFNFEKLKEECFGGDKNSEDDSSWSFGGSYGKSAYMLVYERRKKKPLKILVPESQDNDVHFDEKNKEYYKLIDYREGVEDLKPNQIYKQVFEDNKKFEFENDIYSNEFFDFVQGILQSVLNLNQDGDEIILESVKYHSLLIAKKAIFDILAKCFHNSGIKNMGDMLISIMQANPKLPIQFMKISWDEDQFNYLFTLLLDCPDSQARTTIAHVLKYILNKIKLEDEKDILYETEMIEQKNDKDEVIQIQQPKALCSRFFEKAISLFNTKVAQNWSRFENFFELVYCFALGIQEEQNQFVIQEQRFQETKLDEKEQRQRELIGLEFLHKHQIVEKSCDFLLGKKSPLCQIGEKRYEMGGSFTSPNYSSLIKLVTKLIQDEEILSRMPLSDLEKKMILQNDLLKVMLGSSQGSKQFGKCLANMCKDNVKLSKKVAKVFIKSINSSNYESVKNYLTALKPFLKLDDTLKEIKLEWILGVSQVLARKGFRDERFRYGLEHIDKINDDVAAYISPLNCGNIEALLSQLIKCKGRLDTFAINCLKELLSLMAKDEFIAKFVYNQMPITYQFYRYTDWIRPYLEYQKADIEKGNSYSYFKSKHEAILKSIEYLGKFEQICKKFDDKERELYEKLQKEGYFQGIEQDWLPNNPDVIKHYIPQLIVNRQVGEEKEFLVYDENPHVKIVIYEILNQYNYSNPTGYFNLGLPHVELRTGNYQTLSYYQYKRNYSQSNQTQDEDRDPEEMKTNEINEQDIITINWFERQKEGPILLKVMAISKSKNKIKVKVQFQAEEGFQNVYLPKSQFNEVLIETDSKCITHLMKIDPSKEWGKFTIKVESKENNPIPPPPYTNSMGIQLGPNVGATFQVCQQCRRMNDLNEISCFQCGTALSQQIGGQYDSQVQYFDLG